MRTRYGSERWRAAAGTALAAVLAFALMGTVPLAFAEEENDASETEIEVPEKDVAHIEDDAAQLTSAFRLGDVRLSVVAADADADSLALGVPTEHAYVITNEGELAYVRLASSLVCGSLEQPNEGDVYDGEPGITYPEDKDPDESPDTSGIVIDENASMHSWRLAEDGWWYRNEPLAPGESITVRVLVEIPLETAWEEAFKTGAPSSIEESVRVEAVQARNMSIDTAATHPWGDLEVEVPDRAGFDGSDTEQVDMLPSGSGEEGDLV